mmetsp:Transcript_16953/g.39114  ORF Transcript_16953/g.39114 Transcript_16953/m.39114 type:complete len:330 (-) Transcript_16953:201-1190(-)
MMGGPEVPFAFGRTDATDGTTSPPDGRLPNADMGSDPATAQHLRDVFYRMGFDDKEIVALSGAHALGRCHEDASGYWVIRATAQLPSFLSFATLPDSSISLSISRSLVLTLSVSGARRFVHACVCVRVACLCIFRFLVCACVCARVRQGPWTRAESTFSNEYFRLLKEETWRPKKAHKDSSGGKACPWTGPKQYESSDGELMMLPSDMVLTKDPKFDAWVVKYKDDEELFFKDFSAAFGKLLALGVPASGGGGGGGGGRFFNPLAAMARKSDHPRGKGYSRARPRSRDEEEMAGKGQSRARGTGRSDYATRATAPGGAEDGDDGEGSEF